MTPVNAKASGENSNAVSENSKARSENIKALRADFPILAQTLNGSPLVYLDNAATTQKPRAVIDAISHYYENDNANVHRAAHQLSARATDSFENARRKVAAFLGGVAPETVIWTRGSTESINLVARCWPFAAGQKILVAELEHHSNIVPWQQAAIASGAEVVRIPVTDQGDIDLDALDQLLDERVALVAFNHVSNALGTVNPVAEITRRAHAVGALTLVDGAQAVAHFDVDVTALGCDFYTFSGHKMFGPTGIGVLWGRRELLERMPPFLGGGEMIEVVSFEGTTYNQLPYKFEAGTPDIAGAIGLGAAIDYLNGLDRVALAAYEDHLLQLCIERGQAFGLQRVGAPQKSAAVYSFLLPGAHPGDIGMLLDEQGVAVRTGHHCAQPLMAHFNIPGTVRASMAFYNTEEDIEHLFDALTKVRQLLI